MGDRTIARPPIIVCKNCGHPSGYHSTPVCGYGHGSSRREWCQCDRWEGVCFDLDAAYARLAEVTAERDAYMHAVLDVIRASVRPDRSEPSHAPAHFGRTATTMAADRSGHGPLVEQDGEYLHGAHVVISEALSKVVGALDPHDTATWALDALAEGGWHLFTYEDAESLLSAYVAQAIR